MVMEVVPHQGDQYKHKWDDADEAELKIVTEAVGMRRSPYSSGQAHPTQGGDDRSPVAPARAAYGSPSPAAKPEHDPGDVEWKGSVLVAPGMASVIRIPIPGTKGLCLQLDAPGGYKGSTSTLFFVEDPTKKAGRMLRLDYGPRPTTVNGQKVMVIDYHWNQKSTMDQFGIPDHTPTSAAGRYLYKGAKYFKYGGRMLLVVGVAFDIVSIVQANKPLKRASEVVAGWAGGWLGCKMIGAGGGYVGGLMGSEFPVVGNAVGAALGALGGCVVGGVGGYFAGSEAAGVAYDWAEDTSFAPLMQASENEVSQWLRAHGR